LCFGLYLNIIKPRSNSKGYFAQPFRPPGTFPKSGKELGRTEALRICFVGGGLLIYKNNLGLEKQ